MQVSYIKLHDHRESLSATNVITSILRLIFQASLGYSC